MQAAVFSIINYQFDKVFIDLSNNKDPDLSLTFDTSGFFRPSSSEYELTFLVKVHNKEEADSPFVSIRCKGEFKIENVTKLNDIPDFFYGNSIAILFPYVRAYISLITTQANIPGIILPTLNLSSLADDLKKSTTIKQL